ASWRAAQPLLRVCKRSIGRDQRTALMAHLRIHLRSPEDKSREPVLCQINRAFTKVDTNIRRADVREKTGWMDVEFSGDTAEIERAIEGIRQKGVIVDPIELNVVE